LDLFQVTHEEKDRTLAGFSAGSDHGRAPGLELGILLKKSVQPAPELAIIPWWEQDLNRRE